jgi:hypothetical protein
MSEGLLFFPFWRPTFIAALAFDGLRPNRVVLGFSAADQPNLPIFTLFSFHQCLVETQREQCHCLGYRSEYEAAYGC